MKHNTDAVKCRVAGTRRARARAGALFALLAACVAGFQVPAFSAHDRSTQSETDGDTLTFAVYAHVRSTEIIKKFAPVTHHLESELARRGIHKRVRMKIYPTYQEAIEGLVSGEPDFVRYGPVSYIKAKQRNPRIRLLAVESNAGEKTFSGVIAVPRASPVQSVEGLRGLRFAFGDRRSTTGRYLSQAALVKAGLRDGDFGELTYLGRHDKVAFAVASGNYDAGAMNENTYNKYRDSKGLRTIARFPCVTKPWVAREGLDEEIYHALHDILLALDDPELLRPLKRDGLLPANDSDYDVIRDAMRLARDFDEIPLTFGIYASQRPAVVYEATLPILAAIEMDMEIEGWHVRFKSRVFPSYTEAIDNLVDSAIDIARLGPSSYVLASNRQPGLPVIAQEVNTSGEVEGVFVVRDDAPIRTLQDLRGKTLAFGNEHSTAGRYLSQAVLLRSGLKADDLRGFAYLGRHDKVGYAVATGNYDAGVLRNTVLERIGPGKRLRSIMRFSVPEKLWVARKGLSDDLIQQLRAAFKSLGRPEVLRGLGLSGFVFPPHYDYERVREDMALAAEFGSKP